MTDYAITADGRRLAYHRAGSGDPVVFLEAGSGAASSSWLLLDDALAKATSVIGYDRAGLGDSDDDPEPRVLTRMIEDFDALVAAVNPAAPFVIVAHSLGGLMARLYAAQHPDRVAGLVLLDPTSEEYLPYFERFPAWITGLPYRLMEGLARMRLFEPLVRRRLLFGSFEDAYRKVDDEAARDALRTQQCRASTLRTSRREFAQVPRGIREFTQAMAVLPAPTMPVTVVSGALEDHDPLRSSIMQVHARFVAGLADGRHVLSPISGHTVPIDDPRIVVDEVLGMLDRVRRG